MLSIKGFRRLTLIAVAALTWSTAATAQRMSPADCAAIADRAARDHGSVIGGAARSGARGAVFGAIVGDNSKSARRGAVLGAAVGGTRNAIRQDEVYRRAYDNCMYGRRY